MASNNLTFTKHYSRELKGIIRLRKSTSVHLLKKQFGNVPDVFSLTEAIKTKLKQRTGFAENIENDTRRKKVAYLRRKIQIPRNRVRLVTCEKNSSLIISALEK